MLSLLRGRTARSLSPLHLRPSPQRWPSSLSPSHRYSHPQLYDVEPVEEYRPGGFHPTTVGDIFAQGRYRVVHKLGHGGSSTAWLARTEAEKLVTLKVMRSDFSSGLIDRIPEVATSKHLSAFVKSGRSVGSHFQLVEDHFKEVGPNGSHLCLVSQFAGPSLRSVYDSLPRQGRAGEKLLRGDFARKTAKQLVSSVQLMHSAGIVHGDITPANILFRIDPKIHTWSDTDLHLRLGAPETEEITALDDTAPTPHAPPHLTAPLDTADLLNARLLHDAVLLTDFGQSFPLRRVPADYAPATAPRYLPPEAVFDGAIDAPADVWALACMVFELRSGGVPLFEGCPDVVDEAVMTLGELPEPWRTAWISEDGGLPDDAEKTSIRARLAEIGAEDSEGEGEGVGEGNSYAPSGEKLDAAEMDLLADLLEKMLRYRPEERLTMNEVVAHPWFSLE